MARLARTVVADLPHHVTQRGNRREAIFFEDGDQEIYRDLLAEQTRKPESRCGRTISCPIMFTSFSLRRERMV
jgi:putative transposase